MRFRKAVGVGTRHLFVTNCGANTPVGESELRLLFGAFGSLENVHLFPGKSFAVVSYGSNEEAAKAFDSVHRKPLEMFSGRVLSLAYSEVEEEVKDPVGSFPTLENIDVSAKFKSDQVPGLYVFLDFVSPAEEMSILESIYSGKWQKDIKRRVQHFGWRFDYTIRKLSPEPITPMPAYASEVIERINKLGIVPWVPDQLTINEYPCGEGIAPHVDTHSTFKDGISALSLGSLSTMVFTHAKTGEKKLVVLPRRSLAMMTGPARFEWMHAIPQRKYDRVSGKVYKRSTRVSLTFRTSNWTKCTCAFPEHCDDHEESTAPPSSKISDLEDKDDDVTDVNSLFEDRFVRRFYDDVGDHFSRTRYKPWPKVSEFLKEIPKDSLVLDIGCGNGKYLIECQSFGLRAIGADISSSLLEICKKRGFITVIADAVCPPFRTGVADAVLNIALLHHISSRSRREQVISELIRIVKPGGMVLIYAWAFEQEAGSKRKFESQDIMVSWHLQDEDEDESKKASKDTSESDPKFEDFEPDNVHWRYCHLFKQKELESIVSQIGGCEILDSYYDTGNWCLKLIKHKS